MLASRVGTGVTQHLLILDVLAVLLQLALTLVEVRLRGRAARGPRSMVDAGANRPGSWVTSLTTSGVAEAPTALALPSGSALDEPGVAGHTGAMTTVYRSPHGQRAVRQWCTQALARADFALTSTTLDTSVGRVELTSAGTGRPRVVMVPGTGFNAAVALPWLRALSVRWPTTVVDLPGQPGLSDPRRPRRARLGWYGRVLDEILAAMNADRVVLVGNSLGAAVALAADSPRIAARALVSPAGIIRLRVDPRLALASTVWLLRPTAEHTRRMLRLFVPPGTEPPETEVEWMTLMAACCRTTLAPAPLPAELLARRAGQPCVIGVGDQDRFLPPHRLRPAVRRTMNLDVSVFSDVGHLTTPAHLDEVVSLVAEVAGDD